MANTTEVKLDIQIDLDKKYKNLSAFDIDGKSVPQAVGIKSIEPFEYKGTFTPKDSDVTNKVVNKEMDRASQNIVVWFARAMDELGRQATGKNGKGLDWGKKIALKEIKAVHKTLEKLMEEVLEEYAGSKDDKGVDFGNAAQVTKFLKSLQVFDDLRAANDAMIADVSKLAAADLDDQVDDLKTAFDKFIRNPAVKIVEGGKKIPKVTPVKAGATAEEKKAAQAVNGLATKLQSLIKPLATLDTEVETIRNAYVERQAQLSALAKKSSKQGLDEKSWSSFPKLSDRTIVAIINARIQAWKDCGVAVKNT